MKRLGVIGSINRDTITAADGRQTRSFGGILYTALALAYLGGGRIETWLLCNYGEDVAGQVKSLLATCPNMRLDGARAVPTANFHSQIRYSADGRKDECLSGYIEPLNLEDLAPFIPELDGLLVNFITGFEIELKTLVALRERLRGFILMDVHSLTLGRKNSGERFWQKPQDWERWVAQANVVQMNQEEAALLGNLPTHEPDTLREFALRVLELGPQWVVVTRGADGALGAYREESGSYLCERAAWSPEKAREPTGCGDVFLAGLGAGLCNRKGLPESMDLATRAASLNSRLQGVEALEQLAELHVNGANHSTL
jgi:sugar/nucleoside kinase (ribokinase family)